MDMDELWRSAKDSELAEAARRFPSLKREAQIAVRGEIQRRGLSIETDGEVREADRPVTGADPYRCATMCTYTCVAFFVAAVLAETEAHPYSPLVFVAGWLGIFVHAILGPFAVVCSLFSKKRLAAWWIYLYFSATLPASYAQLLGGGSNDKVGRLLFSHEVLWGSPATVASLLLLIIGAQKLRRNVRHDAPN